MKKALKRITNDKFYFVGGEKTFGTPPNINCDLSGVRGDLSGVWGDLSDVRGSVDDCDISESEREQGINIDDLIDGE